MPLRRKDMNRDLEPLLEDQGDSSPSDLQHRKSSEQLEEILDENADAVKRSFLRKEKELLMGASAHVDTISHKLRDGYGKRQEQREKLSKECNNQLETFFEELERAEKNLSLAEQNIKAFLQQQKCFQKVLKRWRQILQEMKAAHKQYKQDVAYLTKLEEDHVATDMKEFKEELTELHKKLVKDLKQEE